MPAHRGYVGLVRRPFARLDGDTGARLFGPGRSGDGAAAFERGGGPHASIARIDGSAAAEAAYEDDLPIVAGDIAAAIHLVASGLASRVSLSGFSIPGSLTSEADAVARAARCRATVRIEAGGALGLVITRLEAEGG